MQQPLTGVQILDFSTLLPGPMATLILAEAGADVIKIERPGRGDEMRSYTPRLGEDSLNFGLLNRGKKSIAIDLKASDAKQHLRPLIEQSKVVVEQFRPGVMDRLGLGYAAMREINPAIVYCAITGYGQTGPLAREAGHDLNYQAKTGMLTLSGDGNGAPVIPPVLTADLAAGTYPAVVNILLALRSSEATGVGSYLDIAMTDNLFPLMYWALGEGSAGHGWPRPGAEQVTGGSPRYHLYRTRDDRYIAAAPLEQKFWDNFCEAIELPNEYRDDENQWQRTTDRVAEIILQRDASDWEQKFSGKDVCSCVVNTLEEAMQNEQFQTRRLFAYSVSDVDGATAMATPVPVVPQFRAQQTSTIYPPLGKDNALVDDETNADPY